MASLEGGDFFITASPMLHSIVNKKACTAAGYEDAVSTGLNR
jgi:hypothetical protein